MKYEANRVINEKQRLVRVAVRTSRDYVLFQKLLQILRENESSGTRV